MPRASTDQDKAIGARMRAARLSRNFSQADLADAIGVTFQQVQKYESGRNRITASKLFLAAKVLRVDIDYFSDDDYSQSIMGDAQALRAAQIVGRLPDDMKRSALRILAAMSEGVAA